MTAALASSTSTDPIPLVRSALPEVPRSEAHRDQHALRRWHEGWARRHGLVSTDAEWAKLDAQRVHTLAGLFYPGCRSVDDARLACGWLTFLHLFDDRFDEPPLSHEPRAARALIDRFVRLVAAARAGEQLPAGADDPFESMLIELLPWTIEPMGPAWRAQFLDELAEWLEYYVIETTHRAERIILSADELLAHKRKCMAVPPCCRLLERLHLGEVAPVVRAKLAPLVDLAADLTGAINDIFSLEKERERGDVHNLIQSFMHHEGLRESEAVERIARWLPARAAQMRDAIDALPRQPALAEHRDAAAAWAIAAGAFARGYFAWVLESDRYAGVASEPA